MRYLGSLAKEVAVAQADILNLGRIVCDASPCREPVSECVPCLYCFPGTHQHVLIVQAHRGVCSLEIDYFAAVSRAAVTAWDRLDSRSRSVGAGTSYPRGQVTRVTYSSKPWIAHCSWHKLTEDAECP